MNESKKTNSLNLTKVIGILLIVIILIMPSLSFFEFREEAFDDKLTINGFEILAGMLDTENYTGKSEGTILAIGIFRDEGTKSIIYAMSVVFIITIVAAVVLLLTDLFSIFLVKKRPNFQVLIGVVLLLASMLMIVLGFLIAAYIDSDSDIYSGHIAIGLWLFVGFSVAVGIQRVSNDSK